MEPTFSEFSYGFALTNEFVGLMDLSVAPIFPSLIEEGKEGGGYDVKLDKPGLPLFLQFKRSECMVHPMAREACILGPAIFLPYHRFWITPSSKSRQHELLLGLDAAPNRVFYAAPKFHRTEQLNNAWQNQAVTTRSIFVPPSAIGPMPDDGKHSIVFDRLAAWRCSEPKRVEAFSIKHLLRDMEIELSNRETPMRDDLPKWEKSLEIASRQQEVSEPGRIEFSESRHGSLDGPAGRPLVKQSKEDDPSHLALQHIADRATIEFDAQFFVVQESE